MPPRPFRLVLITLTLALAALGLAACGSSNTGGGEAATTLMSDTFGANHPIRSGQVDATLNIDLQGLARLTHPVALHLSGPFQSNGGTKLPDFALSLDVQTGSQPLTVGATFVQGSGYLTLEGEAFAIGKDASAAFEQGYEKAKADGAKRTGTSSTLAALGIAPGHWLKDPKVTGSEQIAGQPTQHVTAQVDVSRLLGDISALLSRAGSVASAGASATGTQVPTRLTAQQQDEIARSVKSATVDVWTGEKDHTLRQFALDVQLAVPKDVQAKAGGLRGGHIALQVTLAQLNQPQKISAPASPRSLTDLRAALSQLGLAGGTSGTGSSSGSSSSATPATGPQADYAKCLAAAGEDLAKVQKCAALLK